MITLGEWLNIYNSSPQKNSDMSKVGPDYLKEPVTDLSTEVEEPTISHPGY